MNLTLNDEQVLLRDSVDRFIADTYTADLRSRNAAEPLGFSAETWKQFAELGWLALPIDEAYGGLGAGAVEIGLIMEAFGRGLVSEPYLATVLIGAGLIAACGTEEQKHSILPRVASGTLHLAFAHSERGARFDLAHIETTAQPATGGWRIDGRKIAVLDGRSAGEIIVSARLAAEGNGELALFLVTPDTPGVTIRDYPRLGGGGACTIDFANVPLPREARLGEGDALPAIEAVIDHALAALGAEAVGIMQALLDKTVEYTKIRQQFGRPLAANQVIRHRLADMAVQCEEARSMALRAALKLSEASVERGRAASAAKAKIGTAARFVAEQAVQLHGGMGVTDELDIGAYFKRLLAFETLFGGSSHHYHRHAALGRQGGNGQDNNQAAR